METIKIRELIIKKEEEIKRLEKLLEKYEKALSPQAFEEVMKQRDLPYNKRRLDRNDWAIDDYMRTYLKIKEARETLARYELRMQKIANYKALPEIKVLRDFLNGWVERVTGFVLDAYKSYKEAYHEMENSLKGLSHDEKQKARLLFYKTWDGKLSGRWISLLTYERAMNWETKIREVLEKEAARKYEKLVNKVTDIVGNITDVASIRVSSNGELNGIIHGDKGTAKVLTIGAGGYNIQAFHFHALISEVKQ